MKRGLDQLTAWVLAAVLAGGVFAGVYFVSRLATRSSVAHDGEEKPGHASSSGEHAVGDSHESGGHEDEVAPAPHGASGNAAAEHEDVAPKAPSEEHNNEEVPAKPAANGGGEHHGAIAKPIGGKSPLWEYKGSAGPDRWADLGSEFKACGSGTKQSPVDIDETVTNPKLLPIRFHYKSDDSIITNTGHTIQAAFPQGNYVEIDGERYDLKQLEVHAPSEHKVSGIPYDLELQLLHRSVEGQVAIVSVLFEEGAESKALRPIWKNMPQEIGDAPEPVEINPGTFIPDRRLFYTYSGSLTSPPCTEGVRWFIMATPDIVSSKQVDQLVATIAFNARPVQALRGRKVAKSTR